MVTLRLLSPWGRGNGRQGADRPLDGEGAEVVVVAGDFHSAGDKAQGSIAPVSVEDAPRRHALAGIENLHAGVEGMEAAASAWNDVLALRETCTRKMPIWISC